MPPKKLLSLYEQHLKAKAPTATPKPPAAADALCGSTSSSTSSIAADLPAAPRPSDAPMAGREAMELGSSTTSLPPPTPAWKATLAKRLNKLAASGTATRAESEQAPPPLLGGDGEDFFATGNIWTHSATRASSVATARSELTAAAQRSRDADAAAGGVAGARPQKSLQQMVLEKLAAEGKLRDGPNAVSGTAGALAAARSAAADAQLRRYKPTLTSWRLPRHYEDASGNASETLQKAAAVLREFHVVQCSVAVDHGIIDEAPGDLGPSSHPAGRMSLWRKAQLHRASLLPNPIRAGVFPPPLMQVSDLQLPLDMLVNVAHGCNITGDLLPLQQFAMSSAMLGYDVVTTAPSGCGKLTAVLLPAVALTVAELESRARLTRVAAGENTGKRGAAAVPSPSPPPPPLPPILPGHCAAVDDGWGESAQAHAEPPLPPGAAAQALSDAKREGEKEEEHGEQAPTAADVEAPQEPPALSAPPETAAAEPVPAPPSPTGRSVAHERPKLPRLLVVCGSQESAKTAHGIVKRLLGGRFADPMEYVAPEDSAAAAAAAAAVTITLGNNMLEPCDICVQHFNRFAEDVEAVGSVAGLPLEELQRVVLIEGDAITSPPLNKMLSDDNWAILLGRKARTSVRADERLVRSAMMRMSHDSGTAALSTEAAPGSSPNIGVPAAAAAAAAATASERRRRRRMRYELLRLLSSIAPHRQVLMTTKTSSPSLEEFCAANILRNVASTAAEESEDLPPRSSVRDAGGAAGYDSGGDSGVDEAVHDGDGGAEEDPTPGDEEAEARALLDFDWTPDLLFSGEGRKRELHMLHVLDQGAWNNVAHEVVVVPSRLRLEFLVYCVAKLPPPVAIVVGNREEQQSIVEYLERDVPYLRGLVSSDMRDFQRKRRSAIDGGGGGMDDSSRHRGAHRHGGGDRGDRRGGGGGGGGAGGDRRMDRGGGDDCPEFAILVTTPWPLRGPHVERDILPLRHIVNFSCPTRDIADSLSLRARLFNARARAQICQMTTMINRASMGERAAAELRELLARSGQFVPYFLHDASATKPQGRR